MAWRIAIDKTNESAEWTADGELVMSNPDQWLAWSAWANDTTGGAEWSPVGPWIKLPPKTETEAWAAVVVYLDDVSPDDATPTITGQPPDPSTLWLAPGEVEEADRVY